MSSWLRDCGPVGWALIAGTLVVLVGLQTRLARRFLLPGLLLLAVGAEVACFDGRPHVNSKFDVTVFVWAQAIWLRALAGLAALALAAPLGREAGRLAGARRGWVDGLLVLGAFGVGQLVSSLVLQGTLRAVLAAEGLPRKLAILHAGVEASSWALLGSAAVAVLGAITLVWRSRRRGRSWKDVDPDGEIFEVPPGVSPIRCPATTKER